MARRRTSLCLAASCVALLGACTAMSPSSSTSQGGGTMSFFVTSANPGRGADFGGLAGADRYCQSLAAGVGAGNRTWRAYLSTNATPGSPAVDARDRIGSGPWRNARGELIASNVGELHGDNRLNKQTALTERGQPVSGRGDAVNRHDILTGSSPEGRAVSDAGKDTTCGNWTQSDAGSAIVGHHDRIGLNDSAPMKSWNSSHPTQGCSLDALRKTGGEGLLYCFAVD